MNEPRVYRNSPVLLIAVLVLSLFVAGALIFGVGFQGMAFTIPILIVSFLLLAVMFLALSSKIILSDDEITTKSLLGEKTLRWSEIARVSGSGYGIKLHNRDGDVTLSPNSRLPRYEEIIEFIGSKRPDLFSPQEYGELKRGWLSFVQILFMLFILGGVLLGFGFAYVDSSGVSDFDWIAAAVFVLMIVLFLGMLLFAPSRLTLEGNTLTVKYPFRERIVRADEVSFVQMAFTQTRNGRQYYVALHLKGKGNIRFSGLSVGVPIAYLVLKNWHKNNMQGQFANQGGSAMDDIAPNWSDKSGN